MSGIEARVLCFAASALFFEILSQNRFRAKNLSAFKYYPLGVSAHGYVCMYVCM